MSKAALASAPSSRGIKMPMKKKTCQFPGCEEHFEGIGASKYCMEHRKPMYRKVLNMVKAAEKEDIPDTVQPEKSNQIIIHSHSIATVHIATCPCGQPFELMLYPNIDIYPKFCEKHRNPYQRERLMQELENKKEQINE
jgi:hypothetical protein